MSQKKLQLGVIGLGRWGKNIVATLEQIEGCEIKAVCDFSAKALEDFSARYTATTDPEELLKFNLDAVLIATPGSTHFSVARLFLERGIPVFIEKPMTTRTDEAEQLVQLAQDKKAIIFVGHVHLYNPAFAKAKLLLQQSGKLRFLFFEGMNNGPYRDDMSALWDWAAHDVSMALDLTGQKPIEMATWGIETLRPGKNLQDFASLKLIFPDNIQMVSVVSWMMPEKRKKLTIIAEKSTIVFNDTADKKLTLYENFGPQINGGRVIRQEPVISYPEYDSVPPLKFELEAFVESIKTKKQPVSNGKFGLEVVKILATAQEAV